MPSLFTWKQSNYALVDADILVRFRNQGMQFGLAKLAMSIFLKVKELFYAIIINLETI